MTCFTVSTLMLEITCPPTQNPRTRKTRRTVVEIETETITEIEGRTEIGTETGTTETEIGTGEIGVEIETVTVIEIGTGRETAIGTGEMIGRGSPTLRSLWRRFVLLIILSPPVSNAADIYSSKIIDSHHCACEFKTKLLFTN